MKWLREFLLPPVRTPRYGEEAIGFEPIPWDTIELKLVAATCAVVESFAKKHRSEAFYGLAFDCNSGNAEVLICLSSRESQREIAEQLAGTVLYRDMAPADVASSIEWDIGAWKHHAINFGKRAWNSQWAAVQDQVANAHTVLINSRNSEGLAQLRQDFMSMATRAIIAVGTSMQIPSLLKTADFRVLCTDRTESPADGFARITSLGGT